MNIKTPRIDDALAGSCGDPACPCRDGDACHYRDGKDGTKAWPKPEPQGEREAFEAWAKAEDYSLVRSGVKDPFYHEVPTEFAWLGWQGARAQEPAQEPAPVLAGWRLVPEEPTPEMLDALRTYFDKRTRVEKCYSAMLYIAPKVAAAPKGEKE